MKDSSELNEGFNRHVGWRVQRRASRDLVETHLAVPNRVLGRGPCKALIAPRPSGFSALRFCCAI
ncbi:MAG: hypothetical protein V4492_03270 [Chlamydiota bacterium]